MTLLLKQTLIVGDHPRTWMEVPLSPSRDLRVLLHDDQLPIEYRKQRPDESQGWPETVNLIVDGPEVILMTEKIQRWLYSINPGLPTTSFAAMFDTWNKVKKVRDSRNYITGERLNGELPGYPADLTFGGAVIEVIRRFTWPGGFGVPPGTDMLELAHIDPGNLPSFGLPYDGNETIIHHLTIARGVMIDGRAQVNPFDYNGGRGKAPYKPCFTGFLSSGAVYIETARTAPITELRSHNPYWPVWEWNK